MQTTRYNGRPATATPRSELDLASKYLGAYDQALSELTTTPGAAVWPWMPVLSSIAHSLLAIGTLLEERRSDKALDF